LITLGLLFAGGFASLQSVSVIAGLPFSLILVLYMMAMWKSLKEEGNKRKASTVGTANVLDSGKGWKARLQRIVSFPSHKQVERFLQTVVKPAMIEVEKELKDKFNTTLKGKNLLTLGGTGPVGQAASVLAAQAGANVKIIGRQLEKAQRIANLCNEEFGEGKITIEAGADSDKNEYIKTAEVVFATGAAGIQLLSAEHIASAKNLQVAADINAVPPSGIAGLDAFDNGKKIDNSPSGAVGLGALAIGNIKYKTQSRLLKLMLESNDPVYLHFEHAFEVAREITNSSK